MRIIKMNLRIEIYKDFFLEKEKEYVVSGQVAERLLQIYPSGLTEEKSFSDFYSKLDFSKFKKGDSVLIFRSGGIGDIMFMLPLVHYLFKNYEAKITFGTSPQYTPILFGNPEIRRIIKMPFLLEELEKHTFQLMFEGTIENNKYRAEKVSSIDLFFEHAGVDFKQIQNKEKIPKLFIEDAETASLKRKFTFFDSKKKRIGIQIQSSSPRRSYSVEKTIELIDLLIKKGYHIFLFGGKFQKEIASKIIDSFRETNQVFNLIFENYSIRDSIILAKFMDLIIAPDSAFVHIAGSLGIPLVGLYGPFPSVLRLRHYSKAIGIDASTDCSPCFSHSKEPCVFGKESPCLSLISPDLILKAVQYFLEGESFGDNKYFLFKDGKLVSEVRPS